MNLTIAMLFPVLTYACSCVSLLRTVRIGVGQIDLKRGPGRVDEMGEAAVEAETRPNADRL